MANISFKYGKLANLPEALSEGTLYFTTDEGNIYFDIGESRVRFGDFNTVENLAALAEIAKPSPKMLYYVKDLNALAHYDPDGGEGGEWEQINPDTGAVKVEVAGDGSAAITAQYDSAERKITITVPKALVDTETFNTKIGELGDKASVVEFVNSKIAEVTGAETTLGERVDTLEEVVGDSDETGLRKSIKDLEGKIVGITGAMHFKGIVTEEPSDASAYEVGDVVVYQSKEYVVVDKSEAHDGSKKEFAELGDTTATDKRVEALETFRDTTVPETYETKANVTSAISEAKTELLGTGEEDDDTIKGVKKHADDAIAALNIGDYAKKDELDAAKTELIGEDEGVTADTIKGAVTEAKGYTDEKNGELETRLATVEAAITIGTF